jgi:hypothetical protein
VKLTNHGRRRRKKENERETEGKKEKKIENQEKQQGEIVGDQRANQTAKPLKEAKKINNNDLKKSAPQDQRNFCFSSSAVTPLGSRLVCVS